jgi:hypothetical protein
MRNRIRALLALTAAFLAFTGAVSGATGLPRLTPDPASVRPPAPAFNTDPDFVAVYTDNVENVMQSDASSKLQCNGDFDDLLADMALWAADGDGVAPDVFLVQQVGSQQQADAVASRMNAYFGTKDDPSTPQDEGVYVARVADGTPAYWGGASCDPAKDHQTNAVIYREDRFDVVQSATWFPATASSSGCTTQRAERTETLALQLRDVTAGRNLTVASVHWPLDGSYVCALDSWVDAATRVWRLSAADAAGSDLLLMGGDFNHNDFRQTAGGRVRPREWFATAGATGTGRKVTGYWHDAIAGVCGGAGQAMKQCSVNNFTASCELTNEAECADDDGADDGMRFDFLFAKHRDRSGVTLEDVATVTWREAEAAGDTWVQQDYRPANAQQAANRYSNHRAVRAKAYYGSG